MSTQLERNALFAGLFILCLSVLFGAGLLGDGAALTMAVMLGVGGTLLWSHFAMLLRPLWALPVLLGLLAAFASLLVNAGIHPAPLQWFSAPLTLLASAATVFVQNLNGKRCGLCNRRIGRAEVTFTCPRCALVVCDDSCWSYEFRRCAMCLENRVPALPMQRSWWDRLLGPQSAQGRCQICMASAESADLRACGKCRRAQCRDCWDYNNGECSRCGWVIPDLPATLRMVVANTDSPEQHPSTPRTF